MVIGFPSRSFMTIVCEGYCASRMTDLRSNPVTVVGTNTYIPAPRRPRTKPRAANSSYAVSTVLRDTPSVRASKRVEGSGHVRPGRAVAADELKAVLVRRLQPVGTLNRGGSRDDTGTHDRGSPGDPRTSGCGNCRGFYWFGTRTGGLRCGLQSLDSSSASAHWCSPASTPEPIGSIAWWGLWAGQSTWGATLCWRRIGPPFATSAMAAAAGTSGVVAVLAAVGHVFPDLPTAWWVIVGAGFLSAPLLCLIESRVHRAKPNLRTQVCGAPSASMNADGFVYIHCDAIYLAIGSG